MARELRELVKQNQEECAQHWLATITAEEAEALARRVFPESSLPGNADEFTPRELEIIKQLIWQPREMEKRVMDAVYVAALERQGSTFKR